MKLQSLGDGIVASPALMSPAPLTMETEAADVCPASNGPCSPTEEHAMMLVDLSVTMPTKQHAQSPGSPSVPTVKQEEGEEEEGEKNGFEEAGQSAEEASGLEEPMIDSPNDIQDGESRTVGSSDTGTRLPNAGDERPFHCSQCGVSFTQKGNLLRHVKLHSGEKPFKCPFCSYACRRRDALTGHLRTHSVGKPHKCNFCGRSYKQRASLEEHKERCHSYMQRVSANSAPNSAPYQAEESLKEQQPLMDAVSIASFDRPPVIERLQGNVGKRKSTTPQKFVGEKLMRYGYPELPYDMALNRPGSAGSERGSPPERAGQRPNQAPWPGSGPAHHRRKEMHAAEPGEQEAAGERADGLRVFSREGRELRAYRCEHCRVLYLDHVMFTIHMGCHGYRDPLECNICGHRSQDRYEFSSHIVRGEHTFH
ncbi:hypothetical protein SKAU_G00257970 [Synaphobranchus kaupii]|uniref:C2H2-type domain-containing protein n=1 Tax=Synaphobranchus kaupii TaxID=118154 RepID=A0A9Q1F450_SYNKA|nr:hypothetical protein SKAU_G00257970 [Synaphobranchus kaupii]